MIAQYPRYLFWNLCTRIFGRIAVFCQLRKARLCGCFSCYVVLNKERIVRDALLDAEREITGQPKVDRRPS